MSFMDRKAAGMDDATKRNEILSTLSDSLKNELKAELLDDERLIWVAQPSARGVLKYGMAYFLFGIPLLSVFMFLFIAAIVAKMTLLAILPLPLVFVGLSITLAPLRLAKQGKKAIYALTNDRLILVLGNRTGAVKTIGLHQIVSIRRDSRDASGATLLIQTEFESEKTQTHLPYPVRFPENTLIGIKNGRAVHAMIDKQIHAAR